MKLGVLGAVAATGMALATPASAVFVDLTSGAGLVADPLPANPDGRSGITSVLATVPTSSGPVSFKISAGMDTLNFVEDIVNGGTFCGPAIGSGAGGGMFACDFDGIGVGDDDEIGGDEFLVIDISQAVRITRLYLLDLFFNGATEDETEQALIDYNADGTIDQMVISTEPFDPDTNPLGEVDFSPPVAFQGFFTTRIILRASPGNDGFGVGDFALAGLDFEVEDRMIPLPGALPLLVTAMAGLGFLGWRRRSSAA